MFKEIGRCLHDLFNTPHLIMNTLGGLQLRNQQTCTFNNHNEIKGGPNFNHVFVHTSLQ